MTHKVLGLKGTEQEVEILTKTFCNLCDRELEVGTYGIKLIGDNNWIFYIHTDCAVAQLVNMHNHLFRSDVKERPKKKRTHNKRKQNHTGTTGWCTFCRKSISEKQFFVKVDKHQYHSNTKNSCWQRYNRINQRIKSSV